MSSLTDFISQVRYGMAKTTHFTVVVPPPPGLSTYEVNYTKLVLFCDQTQIPGVSLGTNQVRSYGEFSEVPYEKLYEPITLSFYVDSNLEVKQFFDKWMSLIQDPETRDFNYPKNYMSDKIYITVENTQGEGVYQCVLNKCYPKAIAPIQLDYAGKDVMKLSVTLAYKFAETTQFSAVKVQNNVSNIPEKIMEDYNYGFESFTQIPTNYFDDFRGFQSQFENIDLTFGAPITASTFEDIGARTGFGGIFK